MPSVMRKSFPLLLLVFLIIACSSPLDKPYKQDSLEEDMVELKKKLSEDELSALAGYIVLKSMADDQMLGKTYGDLLNEAKQMKAVMLEQEAEEKKLAEKAKAEEAERIKRLGFAITVSLYEKSFAKFDYQEYIMYKFAFENKTDKDIRAFSGQLIFSDLFDTEINKITLTYDDGISAKSTVKWSAQSDYNQFIDKDVALKNKDLEDLKIRWVPEKIIFLDGGSLE